MKICAIICEYNPFHNGHLYQMQQAKLLSKADVILCIMSGNFVQRGEMAVMDKFTRAKHAILGGADAVIELPSPFATANAELFAKGAIHILSSIPNVQTLCFGSETANKNDFLSAAKLLNAEPKEVSNKIKELLASGMSYAKARATAWIGRISNDLLSSPNNVLGLEYTRAILSKNVNIDILPISRIGNGYKNKSLDGEFASATAIREGIENKRNFKNFLPNFVAEDLPKHLENHLELLEKFAILSRSAVEIASVCDCNEGLENAFKKVAILPTSFVETLTSARYTSSRIRRIALQNLLQIDEKLIQEGLSSPLYLRVLAVKKESEILSELGRASFPLILRAHDEDVLSNKAKSCFEKDIFAEKIYGLLRTSLTQKPLLL